MTTRTLTRSRPAFTLVELITVLVIVGLLAGIALVSYQRVVTNANDARTATSLVSVVREAQALMAFGDTTWAAAIATAAGESQVSAGAVVAADPTPAANWSVVGPTSAAPTSGQLAWDTYSTNGVTVSALTSSGALATARTPDPVSPIESFIGTAPPTTTSTSTTTPPDAAFAYSSFGDTNGLFYWLGRQRNTVAWSNPLTNGAVFVTSAGVHNTNMVTANTADRGTANPWYAPIGSSNFITYDLGNEVTVQVTDYTIRARSDSNTNLPRNWKLEGTNTDPSSASPSWTTLHTATNDTTLTQGGWGRWTTSDTGGYRWLRLSSTGTDSDGGNLFGFDEVEFYGNAYVTPITHLAASTARTFSTFGDTNGAIYNASPATVASVSGSLAGSAASLTDRNGSSYWFSQVASAPDAAWVRWDFGTKKLRPLAVTIQNRPDGDTNWARNWAIEGSDDGTTWTTLRSVTSGVVFETRSQWIRAEIPSTTAYRYIRWVSKGTDGSGGASWILGAGELELYGDVQ